MLRDEEGDVGIALMRVRGADLTLVSAELIEAIREAESCLSATKLFEPPLPVWVADVTETGELCYVLDHPEKHTRYGTVIASKNREAYSFLVHCQSFTFMGSSLTLNEAKAQVECATGMRDRLELPVFSFDAAASTQ